MKIIPILSLFAASASLCLGEESAPTPTANPFATLTLGEDVAQTWQVYSPGRTPGDLPPSILANLDLKTRSIELNPRAVEAGPAKLIITGSLCTGNSKSSIHP